MVTQSNQLQALSVIEGFIHGTNQHQVLGSTTCYYLSGLCFGNRSLISDNSVPNLPLINHWCVPFVNIPILTFLFKLSLTHSLTPKIQNFAVGVLGLRHPIPPVCCVCV